MEERMSWTKSMGMVAIVALAGCPWLGTPPETDSGAPTDTGTPSAAVSGTIVRAVPPAADNDAVGAAYVAALAACDLGAALLGGVGVPDADLSAESAEVAFTVVGLPRAEVFLAAFLDDDGDADPAQPLPGSGDLVYADVAGDGVLSCVAVDLTGGDVADVEIALTAVAP
jgi:hypothetical protein